MPAPLRSERRFLCSDLVTIHWSDAARSERKQVVVLENISASGACVQSDAAVPDDTRVRMVCHEQEFRGRVRSCYRRDDAYFIGIEFDADCRWSKAKYMPEHLLDPRQVKPRRSRSKTVLMLSGVFA